MQNLGVEFDPTKIKHYMLYLAVLCDALPRNHRKKTICSVHREGNTGKDTTRKTGQKYLTVDFARALSEQRKSECSKGL